MVRRGTRADRHREADRGDWADVLGVPEPGIDDSFFALGGDPFSALKVVRRIEPAPSPVEFYQYATIHRLAAHLDARPETEPTDQRLLHRLTRHVVQDLYAELGGTPSALWIPIVTSWPGRYRALSSRDVVTTEHNEPLVNWHALHGPEALTAIADSGGAVHAVDDDELLAAQALLGDYGVHPTAAGSAALAGLLAHARTTPVSRNQVVLLTDR